MPTVDPYTADEIDDALTALIAYAGNASGAIKYLKSVGKRAPIPTTLTAWSRTTHWERYEELREKVAQRNENTLANNYLDAARFATETAMLAVEKAKKRLEANKDDDPARTASNLARVAQSATEKRQVLLSRPTQIISDGRNVEELLRSLVGRGVLTLPEETEAIEGQEADE